MNAWKYAVIERLAVHIYQAKHEDDPRAAIADLVNWEVEVALAPDVSSDAAALVERGRMEERERLRDCRLCRHYTTASGGCVSVLQCVAGDRFTATAPLRYWEAA
jgi:hypothetical protein